jgi:hypothetical protein
MTWPSPWCLRSWWCWASAQKALSDGVQEFGRDRMIPELSQATSQETCGVRT